MTELVRTSPRAFRAAFIFLTRIPVGGFPYSSAEFRWSTAYFPLVGAVLGLILTGVWSLLSFLDAGTTAVFVVAASLLLTGAFHEDGLADSADALGGAYDRERLFVILKDSRLGTFGVATLICALALRALLLAECESKLVLPGLANTPLDRPAPIATMGVVLVFSQSLSRLPPIWLMATMPYVSEQSSSKSRQVAFGGYAQAVLASLWPLLGGLYALWSDWLSLRQIATIITLLLVACALCAYRFHKRAGGITGDFLGATQQVSELAILLGILAG